jgi:hypothetical protein
MENKRFIKPQEVDFGDNWVDYYLEVSNIKKGETLYECNYGKNIQLRALSDAKKIKDGWICYVENLEGEKCELFMSANTSYKGVNLFRAPQYLDFDEKIGYIYPIV